MERNKFGGGDTKKRLAEEIEDPLGWAGSISRRHNSHTPPAQAISRMTTLFIHTVSSCQYRLPIVKRDAINSTQPIYQTVKVIIKNNNFIPP